MHLSSGRLISSESHRSNLFHPQESTQPQQYQVANQIFNQSFYKQKQIISKGSSKQQTFLSLQYVKKYFQNNNLEPILTRTIKSILDTDYLPENPYNMIYRKLMNQVLYQNTNVYYAKGYKTFGNVKTRKINANFSSNRINVKKQNTQSIKSFLQQDILTKRISIVDCEFFIGSRLSRYTNPNTLYTFWLKFTTVRRISSINQQIKHYNLESFFMSMSGSMFINLEGVNSWTQRDQVIRMNVKANQTVNNSIYTADAMVQLVYYVKAQGEQLEVLTPFCHFLLDDALQEMQNGPNQIYMYLVKFSLSNSQKQSITEWSAAQLIRDKNRIVKEIVRMLVSQKYQIKARYYMKNDKKTASTISEDYISITKTYVLIRTGNSQRQGQIYSPQYFQVTDYYVLIDLIHDLNSRSTSQIFSQYCQQQYPKLLSSLQSQQVSLIPWQLFLLSLHDMNLQTIQLQKLHESLNLLLNSPLNFLLQTVHKLKCCKLLLNSNVAFTDNSNNQAEKQLIFIIQQIQTMLFNYQKQGDFLYPEVALYLEPIRKLIAVILIKHKLKVNITRLIIDNIIVILKSLINSFNIIAYVLSGSITKYVQDLDKKFGNQQTKQILKQNMNYQTYLAKYKQLPKRSLYLPEQIKRLKAQLNLPQNEVKQLLITKYLSTTQLYAQIHKFYWQLSTGKKTQYPLSTLMQSLKSKAMNMDFKLFTQQTQRLSKNKLRVQAKCQKNRIQGVDIYEMGLNTNKKFVFYALTQDTLNVHVLNHYEKFYNQFSQYFFNQDKVQKNKNKLKYIVSIKALPFFNTFSEEVSGIYVAKFHVDILIKAPIKKPQLYNLMYDELTSFMHSADENDLGVIGLYSSWKNLSNSSVSYHGDSDEVYSRTEEDNIDVLKFDYKRPLSFQKVYKFLQHCLTYKKQMQVRIVYLQNKIIQSCNITFNFYFLSMSLAHNSLNNPLQQLNPQQLTGFIPISNYDDRVFYQKSEIMEWNKINKIKQIKNQLEEETKSRKLIIIALNSNTILADKSPQKSMPQKFSPMIQGSLRKIYLQQQVLLEQIMVQDVSQMRRITSTSTCQYLSLSTIRIRSPYYSKLQQCQHQVLTLIYLVFLMKNDKRNKYPIQLLKSQILLLEYYLVDQCLKHDMFVYLEGMAVQLIGLIAKVKQYCETHLDNQGEQSQILYVEKLLTRINAIIKILMQAAAISVAWAVRNTDSISKHK